MHLAPQQWLLLIQLTLHHFLAYFLSDISDILEVLLANSWHRGMLTMGRSVDIGFPNGQDSLHIESSIGTFLRAGV